MAGLTGTKDVLSSLIRTKMADNGITIVDDTELKKLTDAIAEAVINHIIANAIVTVTGVMSGGSSSGPGTIT